MNIKELLKRVEESGLDEFDIMVSLHCSRQSLQDRLRGRVDMSKADMMKLSRLLELNEADQVEIFGKVVYVK